MFWLFNEVHHRSYNPFQDLENKNHWTVDGLRDSLHTHKKCCSDKWKQSSIYSIDSLGGRKLVPMALLTTYPSVLGWSSKYLELPKCPLFWWEFRPCFGGVVDVGALGIYIWCQRVKSRYNFSGREWWDPAFNDGSFYDGYIHGDL